MSDSTFLSWGIVSFGRPFFFERFPFKLGGGGKRVFTPHLFVLTPARTVFPCNMAANAYTVARFDEEQQNFIWFS